jgi:hypothetical protein
LGVARSWPCEHPANGSYSDALPNAVPRDSTGRNEERFKTERQDGKPLLGILGISQAGRDRCTKLAHRRCANSSFLVRPYVKCLSPRSKASLTSVKYFKSRLGAIRPIADGPRGARTQANDLISSCLSRSIKWAKPKEGNCEATTQRARSADALRSKIDGCRPVRNVGDTPGCRHTSKTADDPILLVPARPGPYPVMPIAADPA